MKRNKMDLGKRREIYFAVVILLCFWVFGIHNIYGFSIFPDEFAYWSYAAGLSGYDWSHITSIAPYYSYGYGVLLFFVFVLCKDAVTAYRVAVSINFLFLFLAFVFLVRLLERIAYKEKFSIVLFSMIAVLTPWNLFYTQTTLTETLLICLYVIAGSLLYDYLENNRLTTLIWLMFILMYLYIVHMRTIGVVLSGIFVLLLHIWKERKKKSHIWAVLGIAVVLFALSGAVKEKILDFFYDGVGAELAAGNDYSGQIEKIRYIFTREGFYDLLVSIWGKILYLGLASFGLFYWGIYGLVKWFVGKQQEKKEFALFLLLSTAAQIAVSTIYLLTLGEISDYTYGRYNEIILPFVMALGLLVLWKERAKVVWLANGVFAIMQMTAVICVVRQITDTGAEVFHGYFMVGIGYLYHEKNFSASGFYTGAYLFCEFLTLLVTVAVLFCRSGHKRKYVLAALAVMELALAMRADVLYLEPFKKAAFRDSRIAEKISIMQENNRRVIYINHNPPAYIGILQFMARDTQIQIVENREDAGKDDIVILAFDDIWVEELKDKYSCEDTYGHFTLLYNKER